MTTHTPGPWTVGAIREDHRDERIINGEADDVIATVWAIGDDFDDVRISPEREANARLIAAAPEMRAFVEQTAKHPCQCDYFYTDDDGYVTSDGCLTCDARALLARIDGTDGA